MNSILRLLSFIALLTSALHAASPPNFVVIFIDDMGYGDIGPFGSKINRTPNLDRMAEEGRTLTSFYVAAPVCTPSRAALMTGCYPRRVGLGQGSGHVVLFPGDAHALNPDEITVAEVLKGAGYATGCFGKWHLGDQPGFLPTDQGFDRYFGIPYSNDMWPGHTGWSFPRLPILEGREVVDEVKTMDDQGTLCRRFTDAATAFIREHRDEPFFVYLPHAYVHHPRQAAPAFMEAAKGDVTQAQIEEVDWSVGQVLDTLRELGLAENTLVLFTSDNGGTKGNVNAPLRGGKGSAFEGGLREPTVVWWPGTIPAGSRSDEILTSMDVMPTFAHLAGAEAPTDRILDGQDIAPVLLGKAGAKSPHDAFFYHQGNTLRAVRSGPWKLFVTGELYHLDSDIGESKNVAGEHPDIVARLKQKLTEFEAEITTHSRPVGKTHATRTLLPRPGVEGDEGYRPTLELGANKPKKKKAGPAPQK
ncbi:MAG: sulfatase [Verrucomicrobiales bacterium]|nr:sulfatase [Verrucomicrobiales bacterium]